MGSRLGLNGPAIWYYTLADSNAFAGPLVSKRGAAYTIRRRVFNEDGRKWLEYNTLKKRAFFHVFWAKVFVFCCAQNPCELLSNDLVVKYARGYGFDNHSWGMWTPCVLGAIIFTRAISDRTPWAFGQKKWGSAESQTLLTLNLILWKTWCKDTNIYLPLPCQWCATCYFSPFYWFVSSWRSKNI